MFRARAWLFSPIARRILFANLVGLIFLVTGALLLNELRSGLVEARKASLLEQAEVIAAWINEDATDGVPEPRLIVRPENCPVGDVTSGTYRSCGARAIIKRISLTESTRIRLHDVSRRLQADSYVLADQIEGQKLPPIQQPSWLAKQWLETTRAVNRFFASFSLRSAALEEVTTLDEEISGVLARGQPVASERFGDTGERVISVTVPIRRVGAVVGALTVETTDIARVIAAERAALIPFILVAIVVAVITSLLMTGTIARPLNKLSQASENVRTGVTEKLDLGKLHDRKDEIGDLARALEAMTATLYDRIQSNERFAADVAHELKNPLTSIRSAVETSQIVQDPAARDRLRDVIARDVIRLDRLISDISNLSRLEAEIVREKLVRIDMARLTDDLVDIYRDTRREGDATVELNIDLGGGHVFVMGREGPLGQVLRNLIDNAKSFSPPGGVVTVTLRRVVEKAEPIVRLTVEDQGPGIPPDKLQKVFERFYSDRPKGAKFGNNSGLGLSIVRQIVETHRGQVWAENREVDGKIAGARFTVDLPPGPAET